MAEIKTPPIYGVDEDGSDVVCFSDDHFLSDIVRWLMQNRSEAEEVHMLLGEELEKPERLN